MHAAAHGGAGARAGVLNASLPCPDWMGRFAPAPEVRPCRGRARPLVIGAGNGNTGTSTVAWALSRFGLVSVHWDVVLCPDQMAEAECARRQASWKRAHATMNTLHPSRYASYDWCELLRDLDAINDMPVADLAPFIYAAHPDAAVVLTLRNATEWVVRREAYTARSPVFANAAPMGWITWDSVQKANRAGARVQPPQADKVQNTREYLKRLGVTASAWAYFAQIATIACIVPPHRLLAIDFFNTGEHSHRGVDSRALWRQLGGLVGMPLPVEAKGPFRGPPAWCLDRHKPRCQAYWGAHAAQHKEGRHREAHSTLGRAAQPDAGLG